jgi:uncharacterized membrane protein YfcA
VLWIGLVASVFVGLSLGFLGGGGSILTVPLLVYWFGLEPKQAIAASLLVVGAASFFGAFQYWRAGNLELRTALLFGLAGMCGSYLGGRAGALIDGRLLLLLFASMMVLTALAMWRGRRVASPGSAHRSPIRLVLQGLAVGLFTGLVGAGGGFLIVPALVLWAELSVPKAVGTSLAVIVMNSVAGFAGYASHAHVDPGLVSAVVGCAVVGSLVGARLARRVDPARVRSAFAIFVLAMAVLIIAREIETWRATAQAALPESLPQLIFVLAVLLVGVAAGRFSRGGGRHPLPEHGHEGGSGI